MIKIEQAIIVEGKYDKIKLSSFVDALIITVNGFSIFKDKEKAEFIKSLAKTRGIIILTDSDNAGKMIRKKINSLILEGNVFNAYVPEFFGKEKRKATPSKQGLLGVEGVKKECIIKALNDCGIKFYDKCDKENQITNYDLYRLGIAGKSNSSEFRKKLLKTLGLPTNLSKNDFLEIVRRRFSISEFEKFVYNNMGE